MDVLMPQLGETVTEGTLTSWSKKQGDMVQPGDVLFEIETDKSSMEIPATCTGVITEIFVAQGAVVPVGTVVAIISELGVIARSAQPTVAVAVVNLTTTTTTHSPLTAKNYSTTPQRFDEIVSTPLARRLAKEAGVNLITVIGTGPRGRVLGRDIESFSKKTSAYTQDGNTIIKNYPDTPYTSVPLNNMRKVIARRLLEAKQTIPHFYLKSIISIDSLNEIRNGANKLAPLSKDGIPLFKISLNDCIIKALSVALQKVPAANAVWAEDHILQFLHTDIGVAVAVEGGLITPVLRKVEEKSLSMLSNEIKELAFRARDKKLLPSEYQGGSITISNLGMYGIDEFSAIINPPQSAILAIGAASRVVTEASDGRMLFISRMTVTLSCDHRVIDGALGATLLTTFKAALENPISLFL